MVTPSPESIVLAHQYLYYVLSDPVWSDYKYDMYCRRHGIDGGGGSDRAKDYSLEVRKLALDISDNPSKYDVIV